jgi:hypothetical protein
MLTEEQYKILEYCYNELKWNIIPARISNGKKEPAVEDYDAYFDSKKTFTFEELIAYANSVENPYFAVVLGLQRDGRLLIGIDSDVKDERIFKAVTQSAFYHTLYQETPRGYHFFYYVDCKLR